jgi:hypothetical protein
MQLFGSLTNPSFRMMHLTSYHDAHNTPNCTRSGVAELGVLEQEYRTLRANDRLEDCQQS